MMVRTLFVSVGVLFAMPQNVLPQQDLVGYGTFGLVLGLVLALLRVAERLIDRKNGHGLATTLKHLDASLNATTTALAVIKERQAQSDSNMGDVKTCLTNIESALDRIERGLAA